MGNPIQPPAAAPPPLWLRAARMAVLHIVRLPIRVGLGLTCSARLVGEERIPLRGSVIVAPNHTSFADPVILQAFFPRHLTYLMTERYYRLPFLHQFFRFWGVVPLREGGWNREALRRAEEVLGAGRAVAIFPEGEISRDGLIHEARPGIATLARRSGAPILPVGIAGPERLLPPDTWRLAARNSPPESPRPSSPAEWRPGNWPHHPEIPSRSSKPSGMGLGTLFAPQSIGRREGKECVRRRPTAIPNCEAAQASPGVSHSQDILFLLAWAGSSGCTKACQSPSRLT